MLAAGSSRKGILGLGSRNTRRAATSARKGDAQSSSGLIRFSSQAVPAHRSVWATTIAPLFGDHVARSTDLTAYLPMADTEIGPWSREAQNSNAALSGTVKHLHCLPYLDGKRSAETE